ncbi:MAG: glycosyl hydrolase family 28-related protein, partial [Verrucomicrobiota bacterium]
EKNNEKDDIEEDYIKEYVAGGRFSTGDGEAAFLNLPIEETPKVPWGNREDWISPTKFGAIKDDKISDSDAIQKAIDSGKKTVYLPNGTYRISKPIIVRGSVERIIGCEAQLFVDKSMHGSKKPVFRIEDGPGTPIIFERFNGMPFEDREFHWFEHASPRTVIFKNLNLFTSQVYKNTVPGGKIFIEDVASQTKGGGFWDLKGQTLFARQFNTERGGEGTINILNDGGSVWILGLKTERDGTIVKTLNNGKTEILGGHFYGLRYPKKDPMFIIEDSNFAVSAAETVFNWGTPYEEIVKVSDAGKTKLYKKSDFPEHLKGVVIPLFSTKEK